MDTQLEFENESLSRDLGWNIRRIKAICSSTSDLLVNEVVVSGINCALLCCEGMVSTMLLSDMVFTPLSEIELSEPSSENLYNWINEYLILSTDRAKAINFGDLFRLLNSGFAILVIDGMDKALAFAAQGYVTRSISEPSGEGNITGSHEGFIEPLRSNMSMLRRRIKSPYLKLEIITKGSISKTDLCLCYMRDRIPFRLLSEVKESLRKMDTEAILSEGYVKPYFERKPNSLFDSTGTTERPDVMCAKLLEGKIGILIDGVPHSIIIPKLFTENFQTLDDYEFKPYFSIMLRWIKYFAFFIAILLPGLYIASAIHHPELLNSTLLLILAESEQDAPFSLIAEAIGVLIIYESIREAGIRLPKPVGGAVSIVAGLIIGDSAVKSGFISTPMLTIAALSVISGFITPDLHQPVTILRFLFVIFGGLWGLFGISLVGAAVVFSICATEDYGFPVTAPLSPFTPKAMRDVISRTDLRKSQHDTFTLNRLNTSDSGK